MPSRAEPGRSLARNSQAMNSKSKDKSGRVCFLMAHSETEDEKFPEF